MKSKKAAVDWASPTTLIAVILAILLALTFFLYIWKLQGRLAP